ncbi:MAG: Gamma-glutamyltranspeptidase [Verrucomicrobia subdivision 3 bacterium]|nr:Gamma-glutamyltranspeptidase [Limisphaerales bacterium]MCS1417124.1 Gamma-glutamyltranspeptidase [Limisphaerales bacterium]
MDDFSSKPGVPNAYGLTGGEKNAIQPRKRMLNSISPALIFGPAGSVTATRSPGGSRIITTMLQMVSNLVDHQMNIAKATRAPRMHHQWLPDVL